MERRHFLTSLIAASTLAVEASGRNLQTSQATAERRNPEYYELRRYRLQSGPKVELANRFLADALVPALNRLGISPVGVFTVTIGPESPSLYLLIPSISIETLVTAESRLERDGEYQKAGAPFLNAPAQEPAYVRAESFLLRAFEGMPKLQVPPLTAERRPRLFELRTYESPSDQDHKRKVEMFNSGEIDVFGQAGFWSVFYGDTIIGSRLPNLTYMLCFSDLADRDKKWDAFRSSPEWKKLSASPRYTFEAIVSSTTNVILGPTPYSQI
jgi:hypothetical protein